MLTSTQSIMLVWPVGESSYHDVTLTIQTNLALFTKEFLPSMANTNHGHILNVSSMSGYIPPAGLADYAASKSGIIAFHEVRDTWSMPNPDYETFQ